MKRLLLVLIVLVGLFALSSAVLASENSGCCCAQSLGNQGWVYGVNRTFCQSIPGVFNSTATGPECGLFCVQQCPRVNCESPKVYSCSCGNTYIDAIGGFCCAAQSYRSGNQADCQSICTGGPVPRHILNGTVKYVGGATAPGATVRITGQTPSTANNQGYYEIELDGGKTYSFYATKSTSSGTCTSATTSVYLNQNMYRDVIMTCQTTSGECSAALNRICCKDDQICVDANGVTKTTIGAKDCLTGSCFEDCSCQPAVIIGPGCTYGCSYINNSFCDGTTSQLYNLQIPEQYAQYCSICPNDIDCLMVQCNQTQAGACDNICPEFCGPADDPDCGNACDFEGVLSWCNGNEFIYPVPAEPDNINTTLYCQNCNGTTNVSFCPQTIMPPDTTSHCNNTLWDYTIGEQCDESTGNPTLGCLEDYTCHNCSCVPDECFYRAPPHEVKAKNVTGKWIVNITWLYDDNEICPDDPLSKFKLFRCKDAAGGACNNFPLNYGIRSDNIIKDLRYYEDTNTSSHILLNNTKYCYVVMSVYDSGKTRNSEVACVTTGDAICMLNHSNRFCVENDAQQYTAFCNEGNRIKQDTDCGAEAFCYENGTDVRCIDGGPCNDCNSIYGLFSNFALKTAAFRVNYSDLANPVTCSYLKNNHVCYPDSTLQSVDMLHSCADVESCYDYASNDTCTNNPCGLPPNECEWHSYNGNLGLGICANKKIEKQECNLCNDNNKIFPVCTKDMCELYGLCYFDISSQCTSARNIICEDYTNIADCTGSDQTNNFDLNHQSNEITINSDDKYNLSKCKWNQDNCYRDADDNSDNPSVKDCLNNSELMCSRDFGSPTSNVVVNTTQFGAIVTMPFTLTDQDDNYPPGELKLMYCLGDNCPAQQTETSAYQEVDVPDLPLILTFDTTINEPDKNNESHQIHYYSRDPAKNLEVVKNFNFTVDRNNPVLTNFTYSYVSYELSQDNWLSDANVSLKFDETVTCSMKLDEGNQKVIELPKNLTMQNFSLTFLGLSDSNNYYLRLNCVDKMGNPSDNTSVRLIIEGDKRITNITPDHQKFRQLTINLSLMTQNDALCKYTTSPSDTLPLISPTSTNPSNHVFAGTFDTTDKRLHKKTITFNGSGVYRFFTGCEINSTQPDGTVKKEVVYKNAGDTIYFSIDLIPPVTNINKTEPLPAGDMDFGPYYRSVKMNFRCFEKPGYIDNYNQYWKMSDYGFDGSFGCEGLYLCEVPEGQGTCTPAKKTQPHTIDLKFTTPHMRNHTYIFFSNDTGYNKETENNGFLRRTVKIDNVNVNMSATVSKNTKTVTIIGYGTYRIDIDSNNKEIRRVDRLSLYKKIESGQYVLLYGLVPTIKSNNMGFYAEFMIDQLLVPLDKTGKIKVETQVYDQHNLTTTKEFTFDLSTKQPAPATLEPIFNPSKVNPTEKTYIDDLGRKYPFKYYSGTTTLGDGTVYKDTFFVRDSHLFVTGTTSVLGKVTMYLTRGVILPSSLIYDQLNPTNLGAETYEAEGTVYEHFSAQPGEDTIELVGSAASQTWLKNKFVALSQETGVTEYGRYGKFYMIKEDPVVNNAGNTVIKVAPALEKQVNSQKVYLYTKDHMNNWFGLPVNFVYDPTGNNSYEFQIKVEDENNNFRFTAPVKVFFDSKPPLLEEVNPDPAGGTITNENQSITMKISEHSHGSGINQNNVKFLVDNTEKTVSFRYNKTENGQRTYYLTYAPGQPWSNGNHSIKAMIEDYAGNPLDNNGFFGCGPNNADCDWSIEVDRNAPSPPKFILEGVVIPNPDPHYRWVIDDSTPVFTLDFTLKSDNSTENLNITTPIAALTSGPTNTTIGCAKTARNVFRCEFADSLAEGLYNFTVKAKKEQQNQALGTEGKYSYRLIVDQQAPIFSINKTKEYIKPGDQLELEAHVINEQFDLIGEVTIENQPPINLSAHKIGENNYSLIIPPESLNWGPVPQDRTVPIIVNMKDYAGHSSQQTTSVILDNSTPEIIIQNIVAEILVKTSPTNATVGSNETMTNLTIFGSVSNDAERICMYKGGGTTCLNRCPGVGGCIDDADGFNITTIIQGSLNDVTLSSIIMSAKDYAGHEMNASLFVLIDLQAPREPTIEIASQE